MASKKNKLLTWHPNHGRSGGRWRKYVDGKVYYFGHGRSRDDVRSYREAERRYVELLKKRDAAKPVEVVASRATVAQVIEMYLQQQLARARRGEITPTSFDTTRCAAQVFADSIGSGRRFGTVSELDLDAFRNHQLALPVSEMTQRPIRPSTAKRRLDFVKSLMTWAWERRLAEMPRNLRRYSVVNMPAPEANPFTLDEVHALWDAASPRLRCFMALALNAGMGQTDISDLRRDEIDLAAAYIERGRSKTGIWARYRLWPLTMELLVAEVADGNTPDDRALVNVNGLPLVRRWLTDNGRLRMSDAIKNLFWRVQRTTGINGGRGFYALRTTGATQIERIDPLVTEMYLAHAERGLKKHYAARDWSALDAALDELGRVLNLT